MSSEQVVTPEVAEAPEPQPKSGRGLSSRWFLLIGAVIVFNIVALILVPPFPKEGAPGDACAFPVCFIKGTLEFPAPHVVWAPAGSTPPPANELVDVLPEHQLHDPHDVDRHGDRPRSSRSSWSAARSSSRAAPRTLRVVLRVPERLRDRHRRPAAKPYIPLFVAFFLLILFCNWSGLIPPVGRIEELRAPDQRRQHHARARARRASSTSSSRASASSAFGGYAGKFFPLVRVQERDRRRASSPCSSAWSSSCSSSSSRSRCRCVSSATSTAARSRSASSPR